MRRFIVTYNGEEYECVLFSDGEVYIHDSSIVPPEFDSMDKFKQFMWGYNKGTYPNIRWIDAEVEL